MFSSFLIFVTIDRFDRKGHFIHYPHGHLLIVSGLLPSVIEGGMTSWFIQASNSLCWRVQTINLLFKGFTAEYLDEVKPISLFLKGKSATLTSPWEYKVFP